MSKKMDHPLGYEPASEATGAHSKKEGFKPHKSGDNKAGNAPTQAGTNSKKGTESHDGVWTHDKSTTQGPIQA